MSVLATGAFWAATAERAVKTAAQTGVGLLGTTVTGILEVDWGQAGSVMGMAAVLSVLTSIASAGAGNAGPSLTTEELVPSPTPLMVDPGPKL